MSSQSKKGIKRRTFIKKSSAGFLGAGMLNSKKSFGLEEKNTKDESPGIKQYRTLGRTGFRVSDIGLGGSYVNEEEIVKALIRAGVNYIDTAESYNERVIGSSIKEFDRKSLFITTKMTAFKNFETKEQILARARKSLEKLQTDYIDCLMIHAAQSVEMIKSEAFHAAVNQLKNEGKLRFCGVSCHGSMWIHEPKESMEDILLAAVEDSRFDVLLLTYNYLMQDMGKKIMRACKEKNIGTTIMKTDPYSKYFVLQEMKEKMIKEGKTLPKFAKNLLSKFEQYKEQAESFIKKHNLTGSDEIRATAIRFVLDNPDADCVLIGFNTFEDIDKYVTLSGNPLSSSDKKTLKDYEKSIGRFYCRHACGVCEEHCPHHVPVNTIMRYDQYFHAQKREKYAKEEYAALPGPKAEACENCPGYCEKHCPYNVPVQSLLNIAHKKLTFAC